jgi:hypothetical protein
MARSKAHTSTSEVEITDAMVAAGVAVFRAYDSFDFFAETWLGDLITEAYVAMRLIADFEDEHLGTE